MCVRMQQKVTEPPTASATSQQKPRLPANQITAIHCLMPFQTILSEFAVMQYCALVFLKAKKYAPSWGRSVSAYLSRDVAGFSQAFRVKIFVTHLDWCHSPRLEVMFLATTYMMAQWRDATVQSRICFGPRYSTLSKDHLL